MSYSSTTVPTSIHCAMVTRPLVLSLSITIALITDIDIDIDSRGYRVSTAPPKRARERRPHFLTTFKNERARNFEQDHDNRRRRRPPTVPPSLRWRNAFARGRTRGANRGRSRGSSSGSANAPRLGRRTSQRRGRSRMQRMSRNIDKYVFFLLSARPGAIGGDDGVTNALAGA